MATMATEKHNYEELNERQQAYVDALAEIRARNLDESTELIQEGMEKQGFDAYSRSTVSTYKKLFGEIISKRKQMIANERIEHDGQERIEVDEGNASYDGPAKGIDMCGQHITERPNKGNDPDTGKVLEVSEKLGIVLDRDGVLEILNADISKELREEILMQIIAEKDEA